jgi:hypothetical protein
VKSAEALVTLACPAGPALSRRGRVHQPPAPTHEAAEPGAPQPAAFARSTADPVIAANFQAAA